MACIVQHLVSQSVSSDPIVAHNVVRPEFSYTVIVVLLSCSTQGVKERTFPFEIHSRQPVTRYRSPISFHFRLDIVTLERDLDQVSKGSQEPDTNYLSVHVSLKP
jgi:hypothetical protein